MHDQFLQMELNFALKTEVTQNMHSQFLRFFMRPSGVLSEERPFKPEIIPFKVQYKTLAGLVLNLDDEES